MDALRSKFSTSIASIFVNNISSNIRNILQKEILKTIKIHSTLAVNKIVIIFYI